MEGHYEMETDETYRVRVGEEALYFSAAHFITYGGSECEHLHGHNYRVQVALGGSLNRNAYVYDFVRLRELVADLLSELDHQLLLPEENPAFEVRRSRDEVEVAAAGDDGDVRYLAGLEPSPVPNVHAQQVVIEFERAVDVAHAEGDVIHVDDVHVHERQLGRRPHSD